MIEYGAPNNSPMTDENGFITPLWSAFFDEFVKQTTVTSVPIGGEMLFDGSAIPDGWLFCDGRELSRRFYNGLFEVIGTRYGAGDGSDTFNIPDRRGKFVRGATSIGTVQEGGEDEFTLGIENLPNVALTVLDPGHTHTFAGAPTPVTVSDPGHVHTGGATTTATDLFAAGTDAKFVPGNTGNATTGITIPNITPLGNNAASATGVTVNLDGGGEPMNAIPPFLSVAFIIKY